MQPEIQRFCWFDTVGLKGSARETIWKYKRAIEGHKLVLDHIDFFMEQTSSTGEMGNFQVYEGHVYSHWGSFPGIFDQSCLGGYSTTAQQTNTIIPLSNYAVKEMTMSYRNQRTELVTRFCAIVWFYEIPMSKAETFEYAVKQPRYKYRHGSARTLDRFED